MKFVSRSDDGIERYDLMNKADLAGLKVRDLRALARSLKGDPDLDFTVRSGRPIHMASKQELVEHLTAAYRILG